MDGPWVLFLTVMSLVAAVVFTVAGLAGTSWFTSDDYHVNKVSGYAAIGLWKVCFTARKQIDDNDVTVCTTWGTIKLDVTGRVHGARAALVFAVLAMGAAIVCIVVSCFKPNIKTFVTILTACLSVISGALVFTGIGLFIMEKGNIEEPLPTKLTISYTLALAVIGGLCAMAAAAGTMLNILKRKKTDDHDMQQALGDPVDARVTGDDNNVTTDAKDVKVEFKKARNNDAELVLA